MSEGPTKADLGEGDNEVVTREADLNNLNKKESGWINPLSIPDDGTDDDSILYMPPLKKKEDTWRMPTYTLDEDIVASMKSEQLAEKEVPKHEKRFAEMRKIEEAKQAEMDA